MTFGVGCHLAWTSPTIPKLKSNDTLTNPFGDHPASLSDISLIVGSYYIGSFVGCLIPARVLDSYGRRPAMAFIAACMTAASFTLAFSYNLWMYCLCRLVLGMGKGASMIMVPMYTGEVAHKKNRGRLVLFMPILVLAGMVYSYATGPYFSTRVFTLLCTLPVLISLISILTFVPESPYFLVTRNKPKHEVADCLRKLRCSKHVEEELKQIENVVRQKMKTGQQQSATYMSLLQDPKSRKAFKINTLMMIFHLLSGVTVTHAFLGPLFDSVSNSHWSGNSLAIFVSSVKFVAALVATATVERYGRKPLLISSSTCAAICHFLLGLYFQLQALKLSFVQHISLIPLISVVVFAVGYSFGLGPVPFAYLSELFPQQAKNIGVPVCMAIATVTNTAIALTFPYFMEYLGMQWCFWIFALNCLCAAIFTKYQVPETKGRTLEEIQLMLD
nr:unnamed protein product [Callosobruchus chinensis]